MIHKRPILRVRRSKHLALAPLVDSRSRDNEEVLFEDNEVHCGEVSQGEKMLKFGSDQESYKTEYTVVYQVKKKEGPGTGSTR